MEIETYDNKLNFNHFIGFLLYVIAFNHKMYIEIYKYNKTYKNVQIYKYDKYINMIYRSNIKHAQI